MSVSPPIGTSQTPLFVFVEPAFSFSCRLEAEAADDGRGRPPFLPSRKWNRLAASLFCPRTAVRRICRPWVRGGRNKAMPPASRVVLRSPSGFDLPSAAAAAAGRNGIKPVSLHGAGASKRSADESGGENSCPPRKEGNVLASGKSLSRRNRNLLFSLSLLHSTGSFHFVWVVDSSR